MLIDELNNIGYECSTDDKNIIKKLTRLNSEGSFYFPNTIQGLLSINEGEFLKTLGIGNKYRYLLENLRKRVKIFLGEDRLKSFLTDDKTLALKLVPIAQVSQFFDDIHAVFNQIINIERAFI